MGAYLKMLMTVHIRNHHLELVIRESDEAVDLKPLLQFWKVRHVMTDDVVKLADYIRDLQMVKPTFNDLFDMGGSQDTVHCVRMSVTLVHLTDHLRCADLPWVSIRPPLIYACVEQPRVLFPEALMSER